MLDVSHRTGAFGVSSDRTVFVLGFNVEAGQQDAAKVRILVRQIVRKLREATRPWRQYRDGCIVGMQFVRAHHVLP